MRLRGPSSLRARERGVMLIEALVAILIFSIGILAVVGMQGVAIKDVTAARYRSEAAYLAQQLLSQMWTDNGNIAAYAYPGTGGVPPKISDWVNAVQTGPAKLPDSIANPPIVAVSNLVAPGPLPPAGATTGATVQITLRWRLPEEVAQNLPAHSFTVIGFVYPASSS